MWQKKNLQFFKMENPNLYTLQELKSTNSWSVKILSHMLKSKMIPDMIDFFVDPTVM